MASRLSFQRVVPDRTARAEPSAGATSRCHQRVERGELVEEDRGGEGGTCTESSTGSRSASGRSPRPCVVPRPLHLPSAAGSPLPGGEAAKSAQRPILTNEGGRGRNGRIFPGGRGFRDLEGCLQPRIPQGISSVVRRGAAPAASGSASLPRAPMPVAPGGETPRRPAHPSTSSRRDVATIYGIEGLLAGRTLMNRYRIEEVIGRGGMGAVYRARDAQLGREVAVKVITVAAPDREAHQRLRARFQREARAAAGLHHPAVVAVYDYGTDPELGLDFLVMELLRGEDLATRLQRKGPPALRTSLSILEQAARGLGAGHRTGLIHRDVKPGNLYLETGDRVGDVRVKILDFGIAELASAGDDTLTHLTVYGRSPYSPAYASPEQLRGEPRLTPATDVFSLGAVAFHLLTGRRLFTTAEPRQMLLEMSRALSEERERLAALPPAVEAALRRALSPRPEDRFPTALFFAEALGGARESAESEGEHTILAPAAPPRGEEQTRAYTHAEPPRAAAELQSLLQARHAGAAPPAQRPERPAPAGWLRRAGSAFASFLLTAGATVLFGASWLAAFAGLQDGNFELVYAGAAVSVVATPFALHRLMGRRGSLGLSIFASIAGTLGCVYWLGRNETVELVLGTIFSAQLLLCIMVERFTSPRSRAATLP